MIKFRFEPGIQGRTDRQIDDTIMLEFRFEPSIQGRTDRQIDNSIILEFRFDPGIQGRIDRQIDRRRHHHARVQIRARHSRQGREKWTDGRKE